MNKLLPTVGICALLAAAVLGVAAARAARRESAAFEDPARRRSLEKTTPSAPAPVLVAAPKFVPASPDRLAVAMNESALTTMLDNYLVASARGDAATQEAMLSGLRRQPARSRELLAARRKGMDAGAALAVDRALQELQVTK